MTTEPNRASVHIAASPEQVFGYFTRPEAMVSWMGEYAVLDPRPGGEFSVDIRGVPIRGRYLEVDPPRWLLISWGHAGSERFPPGTSRLEVTLVAEAGGTTVHIVHGGLPDFAARLNAVGWARYLARLTSSATGGDPGPDSWVPPPDGDGPAGVPGSHAVDGDGR